MKVKGEYWSLFLIFFTPFLERYTPDKMITELKNRLENRDAPDNIDECDDNIKVSSLTRGLDGRIVMDIKDDQNQGQTQKRKGHGFPGSSLLSRKRKTEKKEFTDSASRYLGDIYRDYVADMDKQR